MKYFFTSYKLMALCFLILSGTAKAVRPDQKDLPIFLTNEESSLQISKESEWLTPGNTPQGPIHSLAEWEPSDGVMTLWANPSWIKELTNHGSVKLIGDDQDAVSWWKKWLKSNNISQDRVSFFQIPTDSIWVRDYGPWFILDGKGAFGIVDTKYNRPRYLDDKVPLIIGKELSIPVFDPGLVHTGGNYYNDGLGNAFSSTLVYTENSSISKVEVNERMHKFLGIERYTTSPLAPGLTIEHMDTFGKLVSPDTWVFSQFPENSQYKADSDRMVSLLQTLKSPYGTPYKIYRMPMVTSFNSDSEYHAYINSFISNKTLYFPIYNEPSDAEAKKIYQAALPGYEIVGVDSDSTEWGDSVHCRSRNLLSQNTIYIFPRLTNQSFNSNEPINIEAEVVSPTATKITSVRLFWSLDGNEQKPVFMESTSRDRFYKFTFPGLKAGSKISLHLEAKDGEGRIRLEPQVAPAKRIEFKINE